MWAQLPSNLPGWLELFLWSQLTPSTSFKWQRSLEQPGADPSLTALVFGFLADAVWSAEATFSFLCCFVKEEVGK